MKLKEFEAKRLLQHVGITTSDGLLITKLEQIPIINQPIWVKAQTLSGGRGKAGAVVLVENTLQAHQQTQQLLGKIILSETVTEVLLDKKIEANQELYLALMIDTSTRNPVLLYSPLGGVNVEKNSQSVKRIAINYLEGLREIPLRDIPIPFSIINKLYSCFVQFDCKMIEINPLVLTPAGDYVAVDASAIIDDDAHWRRLLEFPERTDNRPATAREISARAIDKQDHRGVAGKTFIDLDGDIAILTSGGGASMTIMDTLVKFGGKPANFTEYSGNPPKEKVEALTRIVLNRPNLSGLLIAGVIANFTNIAETLQGVAVVLLEKKIDFPIVIRRAGPYDEQAKLLMETIRTQQGLNLHYYDENTPLTEAVKIMAQLSQEYKNKVR